MRKCMICEGTEDLMQDYDACRSCYFRNVKQKGRYGIHTISKKVKELFGWK